MKTFLVAMISLASVSFTIAPAYAGRIDLHPSVAVRSLRIDIFRDLQRMVVKIGGEAFYVWDVSTGRPGLETPAGSFRPFWLDWNHRSSIYNDAPMPFSIFFNGGIAIHGTTAVRNLGKVVSHGCVRLRTENAERLYRLVEFFGKKKTYIFVH